MAITDFITIGITEETITFLAALYFLSNPRNGFWRLFIVYMLMIVVEENMGMYFYLQRIPNNRFFNFTMIPQAIFFTLLFIRFDPVKKNKIPALTVLVVYMLVFIAEGFITAHINHNMAFIDNYNDYTRILLSILVTLASCNFFFNILKDDGVKSPIRSPEFWIVLGLFFFYFGSLPVNAFTTIVRDFKLAGHFTFYTLIMQCLCFILYVSWIIGFICRRKQMS